MSFLSKLRHEWLRNPRADILSGILVAFALIPETIGFSIIAGVDPRVGLYASFSIAVIISLVGGRPGMISAATAAVAVLVVPLVRDHGVEYLFAATILMGILQIVAGFLRLDLLMQYVSRSVITGFVNSLAILMFSAQLPQMLGVTWVTYAMIAVGMLMIYQLPRFTKVVPSPLVAIVVLTTFSIYGNSVFGDLGVRTVGDMGELPSSAPVFLIPNVPFTWETLQIIFPFSLTMAAVGLLESLLTAQIVDDLTDTPSNKRRECKGQGIANLFTGFLGGMGGCAMIGQSMINVKSGGVTRLSTFVAGMFLLFLIVALGPLVAKIPMPALVSVMLVVSIGTFRWDSITNLRKHPWQSSVVMLTTFVVVLCTHDLAQGVLAGVVMSGLFFASKVRQLLTVDSELSEDSKVRTYRFCGQVFFASADRFVEAIDFKEPLNKVVIDVSLAHFWDISAIGVLDKVVLKLRRGGIEVQIVGLNAASASMVGRFGVHDKSEVQPATLSSKQTDRSLAENGQTAV